MNNITIEQAIKNCDDEIWNIDNESINQHHEIGKWLSELQSYKDKTFITAEFLMRNGFEKREYDFLYCDDVEEISAQCIDAEMGVWRVEVGFLNHCENVESLDICTVGQLRMFLAIEGLNEIVKQLK